MWTNLNADTTDNLLTNNTFDENTNGWTLSDSNVKRDANSYQGAGNSPTIRFKGQTSTISQSVSLNSVDEGKVIESYTISYHGYGCGNDTNWCTDGNEDIIVTNITFTDGSTTEVSSHAITVPYPDGWTHHTFTKSINDTFLTGDVAINFELSGIDTGNSNFWWGPITDNYEFSITYKDYVPPVIEPDPIVEETMVQGLDFSTEVTLDLIQDISITPTIELPEIIDMPELPAVIDVAPIQEINIEMPIEIPEITEVEVISEITIEEPLEVTVEIKTEENEIKTNKVAKNEIQENEGSNLSNSSTNTKEIKNVKIKESTKEKVSKKSTDKKDSKSASKSDSKSKTKSTVTENKSDDKPKTSMGKANSTPQITLPIEYLQVLQDTITIYETIDLTQEMIYGGQQEYNLNTGGITVVSLDNNSSSRWRDLQDKSKRYQATSYNRRSR
tara:strand:+ start:530 stop:1861 length:1332 start_codon:yes stop_codon:yes gene_type:complete